MSEFRVHVYEVDAWGDLTTAGIIRYLQQAASDASATIGFPLEWYDQMGTTWLIRRTTLERLAPARYDDRLAVHTWVTDMRRVRSERAYEVTRERGRALLARATTDWVYVDIARAMPTRVPRALQEALMPDGIVMAARRPPLSTTPPPHAHRGQRRVELAHLDSVAHVNNAKYADYLEQDVFDALAARGWTVDPAVRDRPLWLSALDVEYLSPALYADALEASVWVTAADDAHFACAHRLRASARDVVAARTTWKWQGSAPADGLLKAVRALSQ